MKIRKEDMTLVKSWDELRDGDYILVTACEHKGCPTKKHSGILSGEKFCKILGADGVTRETFCRVIIGAKCFNSREVGISEEVIKQKIVYVYRWIETAQTLLEMEKVE